MAKYLLTLYLLLQPFLYGQSRGSEAALRLGSGSIAGRSAPVFSFAGIVSANFPSGFSDFVKVSFSGIYARDANYFLPEDRRGKYYPFVYGIDAGMIFEQPVSTMISLTGSGGILLLNDRTFSDVNEWGAGLSVGGGIKLHFKQSPLSLSLDISYGLTLTATTPSFRIASFGLGYSI